MSSSWLMFSPGTWKAIYILVILVAYLLGAWSMKGKFKKEEGDPVEEEDGATCDKCGKRMESNYEDSKAIVRNGGVEIVLEKLTFCQECTTALLGFGNEI